MSINPLLPYPLTAQLWNCHCISKSFPYENVKNPFFVLLIYHMCQPNGEALSVRSGAER